MLKELHQEHQNIAKLLDLLRQQLFAIRNEQPVRYRLLKDVLSYMSEVSDLRHHPQEDLIYNYFLKYRAADEKLGARLNAEHAMIIKAGKELTALVDMILMDAVIPREEIISKLESFIVLQQRHMDFEENQVFVELREKMTEDDWRHLEQNWLYQIADDPLFGRQIAERYQDLSDKLGL